MDFKLKPASLPMLFKTSEFEAGIPENKKKKKPCGSTCSTLQNGVCVKFALFSGFMQSAGELK